MKVRVSWSWSDLWIGVYWSRSARILYVCPLPTLLVTFIPMGWKR